MSTPQTVVATLRSILKADADIGAWCHVRSPESVLEEPAASGPLAGMAVGVKDIFDTVDMPTTWGTGYLHSERSPADASAVALLRRAGAIPVGKTVSTELAYFTPGKTRNPHDLNRTPGASSSGSAAAVAAGMVPLALGTQTAGSVIRPAAYCGVIGFKPTHGRIPTAGVKSFSPSLDTVGWFTRDVELAAHTLNVLGLRDAPDPAPSDLARARLAIVPAMDGLPLSPEVTRLIERAGRRLRESGAVVDVLDISALYTELVDLQKTVMAYEAARTLAGEYDRFRERMGAELVAIIELGARIPFSRYRGALERTAELRGCVQSGVFAGFDAVLAPAVIDEAPLATEGTGDPLYCRGWTLLGNPCVGLPLGTGRHGLPLGVQLVGPRDSDAELLNLAQAVLNTCSNPRLSTT